MRVRVVDHVADRPGVRRAVVEHALAAHRPAALVDHPVELDNTEVLAEHRLEDVNGGLEAKGEPERRRTRGGGEDRCDR